MTTTIFQDLAVYNAHGRRGLGRAARWLLGGDDERLEDARAVLNGERIDYWLSVGAQPSDKVKVLIKKYGTDGTHLGQQQAAMERVKVAKPTAPPPKVVPIPKAEEPAQEEAPQAEAVPVEEAEATPAASVETPVAEEKTATEEKAAESSE